MSGWCWAFCCLSIAKYCVGMPTTATTRMTQWSARRLTLIRWLISKLVASTIFFWPGCYGRAEADHWRFRDHGRGWRALATAGPSRPAGAGDRHWGRAHQLHHQQDRQVRQPSWNIHVFWLIESHSLLQCTLHGCIAASSMWTSLVILTGFAASTISSRQFSLEFYLLSLITSNSKSFSRFELLISNRAGFEVPGVLPHWPPFQDQANLNLNKSHQWLEEAALPDRCAPHFVIN